MAEDFAERTESPTPRRRAEAIRQGQIARSADLTAAAALLGVLYSLRFFGPRLIVAFQEIVRQSLSSAADTMLPSVAIVWRAALAALPIFAFIAVAAIGVNLLQVGFRLKLSWGHKAAGKTLPAVRRVPLDALKLGVIAVVGFLALRSRLGQVVMLEQLAFEEFLTSTASLLFSIARRIGLALLAVGVIDYAIQRYRLHRQLRMSRREVQEEQRQSEGDPKLKSRRKQVHERLKSKQLTRA